jgi:pimeloyl-ACP methyl ester carboxylesterase
MKKLFGNVSLSVLTNTRKAQKQISVPTLLMVGHYDQTIPPKQTQKFFKKHLSPDLLTTYEFEHSGHLIFEEETEVFIQKVLDFAK